MYKIFVEVGYYEIRIRPFRKGDIPTYYAGVGGVFSYHKNAFRTFDSCMNHLRRNKFDDVVLVHVSLSNELEEGGEGLQRSDCGQYIQL